MPKVVDHKRRQQELADAVLDITSESGINAVTIRAVAEKSGWSTGVLNHYFGSHHEMLLAALHRSAQLQGRVFKELLAADELDPMGRLQGLVESVLPLDKRRVALTRVFLMFYAESVSSTEIHNGVQGYLQNWRQLVQRTIREAQAYGQIDSALNPAHLSADLVALSDGLAIHAIMDSAIADQVKEYGISLDLFGHTWEFEWSCEKSNAAT